MPDPLPADKQAEIDNKTEQEKHTRHMAWGTFAFAIVLHAVAFGFAGLFCWHNLTISADKTRTPEERKQADSNIEKTVTGVVAYAVGTAGGHVFKPK